MSDTILLFAADVKDYGGGANDGELMYLAQHLFNNGFYVKILDNYKNPNNDTYNYIKNVNPDVIIVDLWKNELLDDNRIKYILDFLKVVKDGVKVKEIIGFGNIATSLFKEIFYYNDAIDFIVSEKNIFNRKTKSHTNNLPILQEYLKTFCKLTEDFFRNINLTFDSTDIISLYSSRGCQRTCSFCSYNNNLSYGWKERKIQDLVTDIRTLNKIWGVTCFALFDNNFGLNKSKNRERASHLAEGIKTLDFSPTLSLNISLEGLTKSILDDLAKASVKYILVGIESLNQQTLRNVYNKSQIINHSIEMINYAERIGIIPVVSYILFHPYLTMSDLNTEIDKIERFGRYRIIQFIANSKLQVIPGTPIEQRLKEDGLLIERLFYRDFIFKDKKVERLYYTIKQFFTENFSQRNGSLNSIANFKIEEWKYFRALFEKISYEQPTITI
ncbi:MAG: radical SAM protein [Bacteroidetes bacterium]|nr:radical SAM protein [Bacteroidota bacterium]